MSQWGYRYNACLNALACPQFHTFSNFILLQWIRKSHNVCSKCYNVPWYRLAIFHNRFTETKTKKIICHVALMERVEKSREPVHILRKKRKWQWWDTKPLHGPNSLLNFRNTAEAECEGLDPEKKILYTPPLAPHLPPQLSITDRFIAVFLLWFSMLRVLKTARLLFQQ